MCLILRSNWEKKLSKALIAEKDFYVCKRVEFLGRGKYKSFYQNFKYQDGYQYTNDNFPMKTKRCSLEGQGIHSYLLKPDTWVFDKEVFYNPILCIIPKGTPYYKDIQESTIISESLIVVGPLTQKSLEKALKHNNKQ